MLKLYWWPKTRAQRAIWMIEETGADYELLPLDIDDPVARADPAFRAVSPLGKLPALLYDGGGLADSAAIGLWLADRFPEAGLAPAVEDPRRGRYLWWMVFTTGVIEPAVAEKLGGWPASPRRNGWGDYDSMLGALEQGLAQGPWLLGERFTMADVMIGSTLHFFRQFGILPENPLLHAYADRCVARPAFQRALAREAG
ncbi:glutathione S-transferase [Tistlia consotensis]|uniref:Glutathione S-transferase n=1 Tax=Tistlia consotensis USBA 355 TaxID=560819 RepID=A0A1Y6BQC8_9PROT|nr:glutathione S-transferase family protein [Tistlia consotensis]SMF21820.1 glutathione S-transferase [Tistlia consotensis USBA 355]SNR46542.1 glutathione S-transferase [Tistlia consotensis]